MIDVQIDASWKEALKAEFEKQYFSDLKTFLKDEKKAGKTIFPPGQLIFNAFNFTHFDEVKVVIIGQDPYHGAGQAHGLSFSVQNGIKPPPSLVNIYKELNTDIGMPIPKTGNLEPWTHQGVLLLNASLTVEANKPASHQGRGWEQFTDAAISTLSKEKKNLVFLLWGKFAQAKQVLIDTKKHQVLTAAHPSPFSAYNGFFGCKHFSKTNDILTSYNIKPVDWTIKD
jgi:uracil-DNA glycosylase